MWQFRGTLDDLGEAAEMVEMRVQGAGAHQPERLSVEEQREKSLEVRRVHVVAAAVAGGGTPTRRRLRA
ncbi:MAG: hypothetical protein ACR2HV_11300 [Acidimicrobiales bacterium]